MVQDNRYGAFITPELAVTCLGRGRLDGLVFAVKDVFAVAGHSSSAGNPDWLRSHGPAPSHAAAVSRLLLAGASLRGAAHTDELMYSLGGENFHYGTPLNPRAAGHIPGGSSSGSAVAVASGSVDFALGTDTGGSVRVPSAYCGVYGFRPSHGAVDMAGVIPLSPGFDTVGWMADSPAVLQEVGLALLDARHRGARTERQQLSGGRGSSLAVDPAAARQDDKVSTKYGDTTVEQHEERIVGRCKHSLMARLYIPAECWNLAEPEASVSLIEGLRVLQSGAACASKLEIAPEGLKRWMDVFRKLQGNEIWATHGDWIEQEQPAFGPDIAARFSWAASLFGQDHSLARSMRKNISDRLRDLLGEDGCLAIPTVPGPAPLRGGDMRQLERNRSGAMMLNCIAGLAGLPQVTLPVASASGLPLGLSVIGGYGQDLRLLSWIQRIWQPE